MAKSKFDAALPAMTKYFAELQCSILTRRELAAIVSEQRDAWGLGKNLTVTVVADKLVKARILNRHDFPFPYRSETRYAKRAVPMLEVLQSLKPRSYFTHATAMWVHKLLGTRHDMIFINHEQKPHVRSELPEQARIDAAFKGNPRISNNIIVVDDVPICMLNGMYTDLLGVEERRVDDLGEGREMTLRVTDLERTLLDITVRPICAGGVDNVLSAYTLAREQLDAEKLFSYLQKLRYVYPYHQAVGWYMEKADYAPAPLAALRNLGMQCRFYLTHKMSARAFSDTWQLFIPAHLAS